MKRIVIAKTTPVTTVSFFLSDNLFPLRIACMEDIHCLDNESMYKVVKCLLNVNSSTDY